MEHLIWTVDPYQSSLRQLRKDGALLQEWFARRPAVTVEPVFVLTPALYPLTSKDFQDSLAQLKVKTRSKLDQLARNLDPSIFGKPKILTHRSDHVENLVATLLTHAVHQRASLIVVRTRARSGLERMVLGSVAETLLLRSPIPLLFLNPSQDLENLQAPARILFTTDLKHRTESFSRVLELAQSLRAEIDLLHGIRTAPRGIQRFLGLERTLVDQSVLRRNCQELQNLASKRGVNVSIHLVKTTQPMDQFILSQSRRLSSALIAMEAKSGEMRSLFSGSITRRVVQSASCPVWAIHSRPVKWA